MDCDAVDVIVDDIDGVAERLLLWLRDIDCDDDVEGLGDSDWLKDAPLERVTETLEEPETLADVDWLDDGA